MTLGRVMTVSYKEPSLNHIVHMWIQRLTTSDNGHLIAGWSSGSLPGS